MMLCKHFMASCSSIYNLQKNSPRNITRTEGFSLEMLNHSRGGGTPKRVHGGLKSAGEQAPKILAQLIFIVNTLF